MRADVYLSARFKGFSRSRIAQAIREGRIWSASRRLKPSSTLHLNEEIRVAMPELAPDAVKPAVPPVLHAGSHFIAFDKPAGLLCHPVGQRFTWGLINLAREAFPDEELHLGHRLDRDTSGINLVARGASANRYVKDVFKRRLAHKTYHAIVRGRVPWDSRDLDAPIGDDTASPIRIKMGVVEGGLPARTRFRVLSRHRELTLVECLPLTGRTHQLRVHLDHLGFPILGDRIYGQEPQVFIDLHGGRPLEELLPVLGHPRHCLHAQGLRLPHPAGEELAIEAPLPPDMARVLADAGDDHQR